VTRKGFSNQAAELQAEEERQQLLLEEEEREREEAKNRKPPKRELVWPYAKRKEEIKVDYTIRPTTNRS
jgi:hypothetical protein